MTGIDPNAEITRKLTMKQMLFPPTGQDYENLVQSGYEAMLTWDGTYKTKIGTRFANTPVLLMLWPIKFLEMAISFIEEIILFSINRIINLPVSIHKNLFSSSSRRSLTIQFILPIFVISMLLLLPFPNDFQYDAFSYLYIPYTQFLTVSQFDDETNTLSNFSSLSLPLPLSLPLSLPQYSWAAAFLAVLIAGILQISFPSIP